VLQQERASAERHRHTVLHDALRGLGDDLAALAACFSTEGVLEFTGGAQPLTGREAIEELYATQVDLSAARDGAEPEAVRAAIEPAVAVYSRHGPLLRALSEGAAADADVAAGQARIRHRFDELVAGAMSDLLDLGPEPPADVAELSRALNLMNESYLLDAFGRESRISAATAIDALTEIWVAVIRQRGG